MRNRWTRPGTLPVVLGLIWAFGVSLFLMASPITADGLTIVEAGGLPALLLVLLPIVLCAAPLSLRTGAFRRRWVAVSALGLLVAPVLAPVLILYAVSGIALAFSYLALRREDQPHRSAG